MPRAGTVIAKYSKNGDTFEILVDAEKARDYIEGKIENPVAALEIEEVFKDAERGDRQSTERIMKAFGTVEIASVAASILKNGHVPLTTEQRRKMLDERRRQIVDIIARDSVDPRTGAPNPSMRIENAMHEAHVQIDPYKSAGEQVDAVAARISKVLPLKFETARIEVIVPAEHANRCYGALKRLGIKSEQWLPDGSLRVYVDCPAGMKGDIMQRIGSLTRGSATVRMVGT